MPVVLPPRRNVLLVLALLAPAALAGCASSVSGTAVADPGATTTTATTTTTRPTPTTTEETTSEDAPPTGSADLLSPTITVAKSAPEDAQGFCALTSAQEVGAAFDLDVTTLSSTVLCTAVLAGGGTVFISGFGASSGEPIEIGGNSALVIDQNDGPGSCQVTVALSDDFFDLLDIDVRDVPGPGRPLCDGARDLAQIVFDKLPNA